MYQFLNELMNSKSTKILIIVIVLDTIFGILRALREKELNSCIGIDGLIRKTGMIITIFFLSMIDYIVDLNLIGFIPSNLRSMLNLKDVGISNLFNLLFICFETLSIFKNMILCKLPIPKKLQTYLENIMKEFTTEIKKEEN